MTNKLALAQDPGLGQKVARDAIYQSVYSLISNKKISGTSSPDYIDLDSRAEHIRYSYFLTKNYEAQYALSSKDMFSSWKEGKISGPDYTRWVTAYLNVWDKINEP